VSSSKITNSDSGLNYGIGLNYQINEQINIFVDYQIIPDFEPVSGYSSSWKSTTIGVNYSF
jgi:opacity protein-like surface antigen